MSMQFVLDQSGTICIKKLALALRRALEDLGRHQPACARIVQLRCFAGYTTKEIVRVMGLSNRHLERKWTFAPV